ncbi:MAG: hypothetical protein L6Q71_03195 [Planctomycetes bacterium]|nr:hypothetical protein [Planctomycetota bacterium]NUQ35203.1 hypothetical protein [Planctomycetaceae bacterium]
MQRFHVIQLLFSAFLLTSCAANHHPVDNTELSHLIAAINASTKAEIVERYVADVEALSVKDQVFVLSRIDTPEKHAAIFSALPHDQQRAIKVEAEKMR